MDGNFSSIFSKCEKVIVILWIGIQLNMAFNKEEYRQSLQDLKMNSKPQINVLTMMAEDYMKNASEVVDVITEHANRVS